MAGKNRIEINKAKNKQIFVSVKSANNKWMVGWAFRYIQYSVIWKGVAPYGREERCSSASRTITTPHISTLYSLHSFLFATLI